jgi:hypothetical protein
MGAKVGFQGIVVRLERTHRSLDGHGFEALHSPVKIELEVVPQRVLRDTDQVGDLPMRQAMTLQPQGFHAPLDQRHRMVIAFIVQGGFALGGKFQLHRHARSLPNGKRTVTKTAIPPRG